ncbi:MAG TPA: CcmD family protein [Polyangiaceae bacterium]|jgi:CcmD family protein
MTWTAMQPATPNDRSETFQAVEGNAKEQYSGGALLVTAYAALWVVIFVWIAIVWRKQAALDARLTDLEKVIDQADAAKDVPATATATAEKGAAKGATSKDAASKDAG